MTDPFDSGTSGIGLALDVPFPANVMPGPGIEIDKANGIYTVGLGYPPLVDAGTPATPSNIYLAAYDTGLNIYEKLRLDRLVGGATGLDTRTPVGDANYGLLVSDRYVALTGALTAVRTWTLPPAGSVPGGRVITIQDEAGGISGQNHINIVPTGTDTIDGLANYRLKAKFGGASFRSDGGVAGGAVGRWSVIYGGQMTLVADANYTALQGDLTIAYSSISAPRVVTLPLASLYPPGQRLTIVDPSGSCSAINTIVVARAGSPDTINGATSQILNSAYAILALVGDGVSKWTVVDGGAVGTISGSQIVGGAINAVPIGTTTPAAGAFTTLSATGATTLTGSVSQGAAAGVLSLAAGIGFGGVSPFLAAYCSTGGVDQKIWDFVYAAGSMQGRAVNDGYGSANVWINVVRGSGYTITSVTFPVPTVVSGQNAQALAVGRQGQTNPALAVDTSIASCVTGINVKSSIAGNGSLVQATSTGAAENLVFDAKGAGTVYLGLNSTGGVNIAQGGGQVSVNSVPLSVLNEGRLVLISTTAVNFVPYNGSMLKIAGVHYLIPSAGMAGGSNLFAGNSTFVNGVANQNLAATTLYYVYVFNNSGVLTFDFSTTGRIASTTAGNIGTQIKSGDDTRSLVGAIYTNASTITDSDTTRTVISWYNRQPKRLKNAFTATRTFTSAALAEVNSEIRCNFICWADDLPQIGFTGAFYMSTGANGAVAGIGLDNGTASVTATTAATSSTVPAGGIGTQGVPASESSVHFFTVCGVAGATTTGSLQKGTAVTGEQFPALAGLING